MLQTIAKKLLIGQLVKEENLSKTRDITIAGKSTIKVEMKKKRPMHMPQKPNTDSANLSENAVLRRQTALEKFKTDALNKPVDSEVKGVDDIKKRATFFGDRDLLKSLRPKTPFVRRYNNYGTDENSNNTPPGAPSERPYPPRDPSARRAFGPPREGQPVRPYYAREGTGRPYGDGTYTNNKSPSDAPSSEQVQGQPNTYTPRPYYGNRPQPGTYANKQPFGSGGYRTHDANRTYESNTQSTENRGTDDGRFNRHRDRTQPNTVGGAPRAYDRATGQQYVPRQHYGQPNTNTGSQSYPRRHVSYTTMPAPGGTRAQYTPSDRPRTPYNPSAANRSSTFKTAYNKPSTYTPISAVAGALRKPIFDKKPMAKKTYANKNTRSKLQPVLEGNKFGRQILGKLDSEEDLTSIDSHVTRDDRYKKARRKAKDIIKPKTIAVFNGMFAKGLSESLAVSMNVLLKHARELGMEIEQSTALDADTASLLVESFGHTFVQKSHALDKMVADKGDLKDYIIKPPVVSVVGHVDHGKTSLLDRIRSTNIATHESGGITQGIGASQISVGNSFVTFVDTPGHEIFTQMRSKGVQITDIVLLIVAADSGIQEQTIESINHIKAAKSFFIVVITKCDTVSANPDKVRRMLMNYDILVETLGGDVPDIEVSAKTGHNIAELLSLIHTHAEILELKANPTLTCSGVVLESSMDKFRGNLVTVIIKNGTLRKGDYFVVGSHYGKVKAIMDYSGKIINTAIPGQAAQIIGANDLPDMGSEFVVMNEQDAKSVVERKDEISSFASLVHSVDNKKYTHKDILQSLLNQKNSVKELNFIIKADSTGSVEAIAAGIAKVDFKNMPNAIVAKSVGVVNESDVMLAKVTSSRIVAFRVSALPQANKLATMESIDIQKYDVIYRFFQDLTDEIDNILKPKEREISIGYAEIVAIFTKPKIGNIAGCFVRQGSVKVGAKATLIRSGKHIYTSKIVSLKRTRDDKREVLANQDCGIVMENFGDFKIGDTIECFETESLV
jgi:translation initiation factor IF-2